MNFYFDNNSLNLDHVPEVSEIRPFQQFVDYYNVGEANFTISKHYTESGVYLIETSKLTHQWTGDLQAKHSFDLISEIPDHVVAAAQHKKLRIVIISIVEGDHYVKDECDGFRNLTDKIRIRKLPKFSVLIMSGNLRADIEYKNWCEVNNEDPIIEFIGASEGPTSIPQSHNLSCIEACLDDSSRSYNSLNRAPRQHRSEHLFYLAEKNILEDGLVSGINFLDHRPKFLEISDDHWHTVLLNNFPRSVDFDADELKKYNPANEINTSIYAKSLLSIVTETYFDQSGLFFSEKIFKPILAGSPQLTQAQPYAIKYLKEKFSIDLDFLGIDTSFDCIENHKERFLSFHESLLSWVHLCRSEKIKMIYNWKNQISENMTTAKKLNFKKIIVDDVVKSTYLYFAKSFSNRNTV